ncbi:MAG TPA: mechanosensitive ion channel family protein [Gaiellaceae bacterium]|nr:mechanosensitive ion channel family protein [Gaiellaceae bacterium]
MDSSSRALEALTLAAVWTGIIVVVRFGLGRAFARYERRLAETDPAVAARRRTTFSVLLRVLIALVALIGAWSVLSVFAVTREVAQAFLASSAVLALIAGLALTTPLGNLGSGVLLAFTQPVRLGDRVTVDEHTGVVERITISYTALVTDEGTSVFVPNRTMVSTTLVNRSGRDPRRTVSVRLPVRMGAPLAEARQTVADAIARLPEADRLTLSVQIGEVAERTVWLDVVGFVPPGSDVPSIATDLREQTLAALDEAGLLPAA